MAFLSESGYFSFSVFQNGTPFFTIENGVTSTLFVRQCFLQLLAVARRLNRGRVEHGRAFQHPATDVAHRHNRFVDSTISRLRLIKTL